eukprot:Lithocolla_globosa_v1_NODE_53_length_7694_cov_9.633984.p1 type:complete len:702 gc:universal NODE_53_length_7694_cov_9.633984:509-2614(+)
MTNVKKTFTASVTWTHGVLPTQGETVDFFLSRVKADGKATARLSTVEELLERWDKSDIPHVKKTTLVKNGGRLDLLLNHHSKEQRKALKRLGTQNTRHLKNDPDYLKWSNSLFDLATNDVVTAFQQLSSEDLNLLEMGKTVVLPAIPHCDTLFYFDQLRGPKRQLQFEERTNPEFIEEQQKILERDANRKRLRDLQYGVTDTGSIFELDSDSTDEALPKKIRKSGNLAESEPSSTQCPPTSTKLPPNIAGLLSHLRQGLSVEETRQVVDKLEKELENTLCHFPQVAIRSPDGRHVINADFIEAWCEACSDNTTVGARSVLGIFVTLANKVFGQNWVLPYGEGTPVDPNSLRENVLGARITMARYMTDVALLSLEYLAQKLLDEDNSVTMHVDDVTKQSGQLGSKTAKVDYFTIVNKKTGETSGGSAGFVEMSAKDADAQKKALNFSLSLLGIVFGCDEEGNDVSAQDVVEALDFFMADREAACNMVLKEYVVEGTGPELLNCNAHVSLAMVKAILEGLHELYEKKFAFFENTQFLKSSNSTSMYESALYAVTKLFSYSQVSSTYTMSKALEEYLGSSTPMKKADCARFGRLSENSFQFLSSRDSLLKFLDHVGGETNMLTQFVESYLKTPWMSVAAGAAVYLSQISEFPLLKCLDVVLVFKLPPKNMSLMLTNCSSLNHGGSSPMMKSFSGWQKLGHMRSL